MGDLSLDLRRRIVEAYNADRSGTYAETATVFGIGEATVSRLLRLFRETGDVRGKKRGGNNPRRVNLDWLKQQLAKNPDARLVDHIAAWVAEGNQPVSTSAMWKAVRACGWTHKKRHSSPASGTDPKSRRVAKRSLDSKQS